MAEIFIYLFTAMLLHYVIIVFVYNLLQNGRTTGRNTDPWTGAVLSKRYGFSWSVPHG